MKQIPFNQPFFSGKEFEFIRAAIDQRHLSGDGIFSHKCHDMLEGELGVKKALLTPSCTDALEMAALLLELKPGDEVIVPSFTFVSVANAFVLRGAIPVFADIRSDTLNLDERRLESLITDRTRAIVAVHYAGVACEMDDILRVAARYGIPVVEDNAHGLFGKYRGKYLGGFGSLATLSFHETKNFTCGEGGALLINDAKYVDRAEIIREKGTDRTRFFRGKIDKYSWIDVGSSYLLSDLSAAFLYAQLQARNFIEARRKNVWDTYQSGLKEWAAENSVRTPSIPGDCQHPNHLFYLILPTFKARQAFIAHLGNLGIDSVFHYLPLHLSKMGRLFNGRKGDCPIAEDASDRLARLPFYATLTAVDQTRIIAGIRSFSP